MKTIKHIGSQPKALYVLFFAEFWERFSFYGLQASLILYVLHQFKFTDATASLLYGSYIAINYATPVLGGLIADKLIGYKRAIYLGAILLIIGNLTLTFSHSMYLYIGLAIITIGTGFFKANISTLVGKLFAENDPRRDSAFTIFYMGINLGGIFGGIFYGVISTHIGWAPCFMLGALGMLSGLVVFHYKQKLINYENDSEKPTTNKNQVSLNKSTQAVFYPAIAFAIAAASLLLVNSKLTGQILEIFSAITFIALIGLALVSQPIIRNRIFALLLFSFYYMVWAASFFQTGGSLTLFIERNVNHNLLGVQIPTPAFFSFEGIFIVLLAPLFAKFWEFLNERGIEPSIPGKFSIGLILTALSFGILTVAAHQVSATDQCSALWIVLAYAIMSAGELSLSPIGLSAITRLAPATLTSLFIGTWFLASSLAGYLAGVIAKLASIPSEVTKTANMNLAAANYAYTFQAIFLVVLGIGIVSLLLIPLTKYLIKVENSSVT